MKEEQCTKKKNQVFFVNARMEIEQLSKTPLDVCDKVKSIKCL